MFIQYRDDWSGGGKDFVYGPKLYGRRLGEFNEPLEKPTPWHCNHSEWMVPNTIELE